MTRLRWGILGYARIARLSAIPAILRCDNAELSAIASRDANKLAECAASFPLTRLHLSYEALLADPDVDAVYIPLPNALHHDWTLAALAAGKHVLCEKPLGLNAPQVTAMYAAAAQHGKYLMEAFMYRYTARTACLADTLASGMLGELKHINASFRFLLDRPNTIKENPTLGGGALYDVGCYPANLLSWVTGQTPLEAQAMADFSQGVDVNLSAVLRYPNGLIANLHCGFNAWPRMFAEFIGTRGRLELEDTFLDTAGSLKYHTQAGLETIAFPASDRYGAQFADFSAAVLAGRRPLVTAAESLCTAQTLDLINQALNHAA